MKRSLSLVGAVAFLGLVSATVFAADDLLITEFMAANEATLDDDDGDSSDWIEVHNAGTTAVNLNGWHLTDDAALLSKWTFPSLSLPAGGYLIVYASGKNRANPALPLHTNFDLLAAGEYLALVNPDGVTVAHQFAPMFPAQTEDFSYGLKQDSTLAALIPSGAACKALIPPNGGLGTTWTQATFNDAAWTGGTTGVGYDNNPDYLSLIGTNVDAAMDGIATTAYVRVPFTLVTPTGLSGLFLRMKYDDGYACYLNGTLVASANAPATLAFDSAATAQHDDAAAVIFEEVDISSSLSALRAGQNVLAIQGMNNSATSSDFLVLPELDAYAGGTLDRNQKLFFDRPSPGLGNLPGYGGIAVRPAFSRSSGMITSAFSLTLTSPNAGAQIRYTLDRSEPKATSTLYTGPISISATSMVRARAFEGAFAPSPVVTQAYVFLATNARSFTSNLPILVVDTFGQGINDSFWTPGFSAVVAPGANGRAALTSAPDFSGHCAIKTRGSSSLGFPKKNMALELRDERGNDFAAPLLGFPSESDWILYGPYTDKTLMRDQLAYLWSNRMGRYAVRTQFIEAYVNSNGGNVDASDFIGVYMFAEKIKRDEDRVDIARIDAGDNAEPNVSGGYILKKDRLDPGDSGLRTSQGHTLGFVTPKEQNITAPQRAYLQTFFNQFETALAGASYRDPVNGYRKYIDVGSFIDHHIMVEMTKNIDGYRLSTFMFKDRGGKLNMGPIWDYNLSIGNANYLEGWIPQGWYYSQLGGGDYPWYTRLFQDTDFAQLYIDRWTELRRGVFLTSNLLNDINSNTALLGESQVRNFQKWQILGTYVWPNWYIGNTYQEEVDWMSAWLEDRLVWWDGLYTKAPTLNRQGGSITAGFQLTMTSTPASTPIYYTLDGRDPRQSGGAKLASALTYDGPVTINQNTRVLARAKPAVGGWSGLVDVTFVVQTPALVITELMYHPLGSVADPTYSADDYEFVEIMNAGASAINLAGARLEDAVQFTFPAGFGDLLPGEHVVVVKNLAAFTLRYGVAGIDVAGEYSGNLSNAGERLKLFGPINEPILDFSYSDDWEPSTDGLDYSMTIVDPHAPYSSWGYPLSWKPSSVAGGTPGTSDGGAVGGLQLAGDVNQDGVLSIADAVSLLRRLFGGIARPLPCDGATVGDGANKVLFDLNADNGVNITDVAYLLNFLFKSGPAPSLGVGCTRIEGCPNLCR